MKPEKSRTKVTTNDSPELELKVDEEDLGNNQAAHSLVPVTLEQGGRTAASIEASHADSNLKTGFYGKGKTETAAEPSSASKKKGEKSQEAHDLKPISDEEILIPYRPFASAENWMQYRFSARDSLKLWFAMTLIVLFFAVSGPGWIIFQITRWMGKSWFPDIAGAGTSTMEQSYLVLSLLFWFCILAFATVSAVYYSMPTHISLTREGITLIWCSTRSLKKFLPWWMVERVDLFWPEGKTSAQECHIKFKDKRGSYPISLKLGAITKERDRNKILTAIQTWAPDAHKDSQLLEVLTPAQDHSYTELWLQALSAPPKRERLAPLTESTTLFDGRYRVAHSLGVGGQGTAYLATDLTEDSEVVLKEFILPVYVDTNVLRQSLERMQNEAAILRKLDNPRIVRLNNFFVEDHRGYLVLERINGESLQQLVTREGRLPEKTVVGLAVQMCEILDYLHGLEPAVIHRDFTPDNLILDKDGTLKLVDFNVAQQTESTTTGTVVGKHSYISPEQFRGRPTPQSDIYAMGATLFYLLTGESPEPIKVSHPKEKRAQVSEGLDLIVAHATAFNTELRYASVSELKEELDSLVL
jgi:serine/threonine-protein kinase